jgi:hypothetical protein
LQKCNLGIDKPKNGWYNGGVGCNNATKKGEEK